MTRKNAEKRVYWKDESLSISADIKDLPLNIRKDKCRHPLDEWSINEIRNALVHHEFNMKELEFLVDVLTMRISFFMSNKFYSY